MKKKILFLDLDGTLWVNEKIPLSALIAIQKAKKNGHLIFTNTGRTYCEGITTLLPLQLNGTCFSAGSEIYIDGKTILYDPLEEKDIRKMVQYLSEQQVGISVEGSARVYVDQINHDYFLKRFEHELNAEALRRFIILEDISKASKNDFQQFMKLFLCNPNDVPVSVIENGVQPGSELTMFGTETGEITNAKHNKGTAIQMVKEYYGNKYETIAFGDSENDLTMFKAADYSVSMGNAKDEIKEQSDFVTRRITDNGLLYAFQQLKLI